NLSLKHVFKYWKRNGANALQISIGSDIKFEGEMGFDVDAKNLGKMKSMLVHATKDYRGKHDCLYVMLSTKKAHSKHASTMFEALMPYMETSLRKLPHLPKQEPATAQSGHTMDQHLDTILGITPREAEIMMLVRIGKTNIEIGSILDISSFTVKNHLQRIYKKLNVSCRAQAASRF
ncbi:MAG: LuxR C-terminal-related transcriptional regulator, partial [Gallionella sp.]